MLGDFYWLCIPRAAVVLFVPKLLLKPIEVLGCTVDCTGCQTCAWGETGVAKRCWLVVIPGFLNAYCLSCLYSEFITMLRESDQSLKKAASSLRTKGLR